MVRGVIAFDDIFDSLFPVCDTSKSGVLSRTNTVLSSLTAGLKYSISRSRAFSSIYGWDCRALSKNLVRFKRFMEFIVGFLNSF